MQCTIFYWLVEIDFVLYVSRKPLGDHVTIEIDLVLVPVVEIDLISVRGSIFSTRTKQVRASHPSQR